MNRPALGVFPNGSFPNTLANVLLSVSEGNTDPVRGPILYCLASSSAKPNFAGNLPETIYII